MNETVAKTNTAMLRKAALGTAIVMPLLAALPAQAQISDDVIKLGITNDQSGIYSAAGGPGVVSAARMAVEDFGGAINGKKIEIVVADNQNKPDIGVGIVRRWLDTEKVDAIVDGGNSAVGAAIQEVTREKNKVFLISGSGTTLLHNEACSPVGFQWSWDSYGLAAGTAGALVKQGLDTWFFITADYNFGHVLEQQASDIVKKSGGKVLGALRHPFNTADFSSYLLQAQASGAKVIALANAGGDTVNAIKQANEFGLTKGGQKLAALLLNITDTHALGLQTAQGLIVTTFYYWDKDEKTRPFGERFLKQTGAAPTWLQAGAYSAVTHYLKAVKEAGTDETKAVVEQMRKIRINDAMTTDGWIREDGKVMRGVDVVEVKAPGESKKPWDYYKVIASVPPEAAAMPLSESKCPLVKK